MKTPAFDEARQAFERGTSFHQAGQLDEALRWYRKTLEGQPENALVLRNIGLILETQGNLNDAVSTYQKAASIQPDFAEAHNNLGNALKELGKLDEAVSSFQKAVSIQPDFAKAHSNLGDALIEQDRLDEAVSSFQRAVSIRPDIAAAHGNLGNALREQGKLGEAVSSDQKAISINPDFVEARHILNSLLGRTTEHPPRKYVETLFNEFARKFETHLVKKLEYSMPSLLKKALVDLDLVDEIWLEPTLGHSVGHVAIHLKSGRHHAAMCGDLMHSPLQLAEPGWSPNSDYDLAASARTRTRKTFLNEHCESDTLVLTAHFPSPSVGHIVARGNGYDFTYV